MNNIPHLPPTPGRSATSTTPLGLLSRHRPVFAYAKELGNSVRILEGVEDCQPFFCPWLRRGGFGYLRGQVGLSVPIIGFLLHDRGSELLEAVRRDSSAFLSGLRWPHSVLVYLAKDDVSGARAHLEEYRRWQPDLLQWVAAAGYWSVLLDDQSEAGDCMLRAQDALFVSDGDCAMTNLVASAWVAFCDDRDSALQCLGSNSGELASGPFDSRASHLLEADAWVRLFSERRIGKQCLIAAAKGSRKDVIGSRYLVALAWADLMKSPKPARQLARRIEREQHEHHELGALFWFCYGGDPVRASSLMQRVERSETTSRHYVLLAFLRALLLDDTTRSAELLRTAWKHMTAEDGEHTLCSIAKGHAYILNDRSTAERFLGEGIRRSNETCALLPIAEAYGNLFSDDDACREVLMLAEEMADNALDYLFCASSWFRGVGDEDGAMRCLRSAESSTTDLHEAGQIARAWTRLLGRPSQTRRCILGYGDRA